MGVVVVSVFAVKNTLRKEDIDRIHEIVVNKDET